MTSEVYQGSLVGVSISGLPQLINGIAKMSEVHQQEAGDEISKYLLNVLKAYPPPKRVTRKSAYGVTFFTTAQRKYFFWALGTKEIVVPYRRTQTYRALWKIVGSGINSIVVNDSAIGEILQGENYQSRMAAKIGWKKISQIIDERAAKIDELITVAGKKAMRKCGFKD